MNTTLSPTSRDYDFTALDRADLADSTKIKYRSAWERARAAGVDFTNVDSVISYVLTQPRSGRLHLSAMMKIQTEAAARKLKTSLDPRDATPEIVAKMQVTLWRLEELRKTIPTASEKGSKAHIWLTQDQVDQITALPFRQKNRTRAMRDYIVLATLLGAGLRREEEHELTFDALTQIPVGSQIKDVLQVIGKGDHPRVILISPLLAQHLREWRDIVGDGRVARSIDKAGRISESLSEDGIFDIVRKYGAMIGLPKLDPHDCRRSCGRILYEVTGHDIMFVRDCLGHKDVKTTMRYIGLDLNLNVDARNFVIRERESVFMPVSGD